jgi:hypothetical protein
VKIKADIGIIVYLTFTFSTLTNIYLIEMTEYIGLGTIGLEIAACAVVLVAIIIIFLGWLFNKVKISENRDNLE